MSDRILVWIENRNPGLLYKSAIWDFALDEAGQILADKKFRAFQDTVARRDVVGTAKMGWTEEWEDDYLDAATDEDLAEQSLIIRSCTSPPKEGLQKTTIGGIHVCF